MWLITSQDDPSFILILQQLDNAAMNVLFQHTAKLREGRFFDTRAYLPIEEASNTFILPTNEQQPKDGTTTISSLDRYRNERELIDGQPKVEEPTTAVELEEETRGRLIDLGYSKETVEIMMAEETAKELRPQPMVNDTLNYLDHVKVQYADRPQVYERFLDTMSQFKSGVLDNAGATSVVNALFADEPQLVRGFSALLPLRNSTETIKDGRPGEDTTATRDNDSGLASNARWSGESKPNDDNSTPSFSL